MQRLIEIDILRTSTATLHLLIDDADPKFTGWLTEDGQLAPGQDARLRTLIAQSARAIPRFDWSHDDMVTAARTIPVDGAIAHDDLTVYPAGGLPGADGKTWLERQREACPECQGLGGTVEYRHEFGACRHCQQGTPK